MVTYWLTVSSFLSHVLRNAKASQNRKGNKMAISKARKEMADIILSTRVNLPRRLEEEFDMDWSMPVLIAKAVNYGLIDRLSKDGERHLENGVIAVKVWMLMYNEMNYSNIQEISRAAIKEVFP